MQLNSESAKIARLFPSSPCMGESGLVSLDHILCHSRQKENVGNRKIYEDKINLICGEKFRWKKGQEKVVRKTLGMGLGKNCKQELSVEGGCGGDIF